MLDDKDEFETYFWLVWVPQRVQEEHHVHAIFNTDRLAYWVSLGGRAATVDDILTSGLNALMVVDHHD